MSLIIVYAASLLFSAVSIEAFDLSIFEPHRYQSDKELCNIIAKNRNTLRQIPCWISDEQYANSIYSWGLPGFARHKIDQEIGYGLTYSDMLVYLAGLLNKQINYLELGVSVGKNFVQVMHGINNATLVGYDIEHISPILRSILGEGVCHKSWETAQPSHKHDASTLSSYNIAPNKNSVHYISGDVFDEKSWQALSQLNIKFNAIFSDACHEPQALIYEYEMLEKYDLIDGDQFFMVWDDLGGEMSERFMIIFNKLKQKYNLTDSNMRLVDVYGWLGHNEARHTIGVIFKQ